MSEHLPSEEKTKTISTFGWTTKIDDDREVYVGFKTGNVNDGFVLAFRNKEFRNYLALSDDASYALLKSLNAAVEYRQKSSELMDAAFNVVVNASEKPDGDWSLVTEDKPSV